METLMAQAKELQDKVSAAQDRLAAMHVKGMSKNAECIVDMTGKYDLLKVVINPSVLSMGAEAVSDFVLSAMQDAKNKADKLIDDVMNEATAGMPLPE